MSKWQQVGENLVRYQGGTIYLRAKVNGKVIRVTLKTKDLRIAKIRRDERLEGVRKAQSGNHAPSKVRTLGDAVEAVSAQVLAQPHLKKPTVNYYKEMLEILRQTLPLSLHGRSWTSSEAAIWWKATAKKYSSQRANNLLSMAKRVGKKLVEVGLRIDDPTTGLKRVRVTSRELMIPSLTQIEAIIENIRSQKKTNSEQAANFVAFLAFGGCRISQAKAVTWEKIEADWITFVGGVAGTKNAPTRKLPISPKLREVIERMKLNVPNPSGPVFAMAKPRESLWNACDRLEVPRLRLHDLRHFFASWSIECGVDIPTVAGWLGHKDGGALVLKTYGHLRNDHSLASAAKLISAPVIKGSSEL